MTLIPTPGTSVLLCWSFCCFKFELNLRSFPLDAKSGDKDAHAALRSQAHLNRVPQHRCSALLFSLPETHLPKFIRELIS